MQTEKLIAKLTAQADGLQKTIDHLLRPMTQNPTPKRMREYHSRLHDGHNTERTQRALRALAEAHGRGDCPPELAGLTNRSQVAGLVMKPLDCHGYYQVSTNPEYRDTSPAGRRLQQMIEPRSAVELAREEARKQAEKLKRMEDDLRFCDIPGFFPTPPAVIARMIEAAGIEAGHAVLEPSAGKGDLADAAAAIVGRDKVTVCEIAPRLRDILTLKGYDPLGDFTELDERPRCDRVLMNPPFEKQKDIDHVRRAAKMLKPGGRLVAIVGAGAFSHSSKKAVAFRQWLDESGATVEELPAGAFAGKDAFRRTGVSSRMVVLERKAPVDRSSPAKARDDRGRPSPRKARGSTAKPRARIAKPVECARVTSETASAFRLQQLPATIQLTLFGD